MECKLRYFDLETELDNKKKNYQSKDTLELLRHKELFKEYHSHYTSLPTDPDDSFTEDILEYANQEPLYILAIGFPKSGITTFCNNLAAKINLEVISIEKGLQDLLKKVQEDNENPQEDDEGNRINIFTPLETSLLNCLNDGIPIPQSLQIELLNQMLASDAATFKGFIFDFPIYENEERTLKWAERLVNKEIVLPEGGKFSHVIIFDCNPSEVRFMARNMMENPEDLKLTSLYDREILKKPKPKKKKEEDEDEDEQEEEEDDEDKPPLPNEKNLVSRANENMGILQQAMQTYKEYYSYLNEFIIREMAPSRVVRIEPSGLDPNQVLEACLAKMQDVVDPVRPLPVMLEEVSDDSLKDLLRQGLENEGEPSRRWSPWGTIDPVKLSEGYVLQGKGEFPCEYGGRVFVFVDEESRGKFFNNPKKYLKTPPKMPKTFNLAIIGPPGTGTEAVAEMLSQRYGWPIIDVEKMVAKKLLEMRKWPVHIPSNPKSGSIHPSEEEFKAIMKGGALTGADIVPMILFELGLPLYKRPPKPVLDEDGNPIEEQPKEPEEDTKSKKDDVLSRASSRKTKEDKEKEREKEKESRTSQQGLALIQESPPEGENPDGEERPPTPPPEDLKLREIGVQPNEDGTVPPVRGFILLGFPQTEEHIAALKDHNINLDRVIYLYDNSEDAEDAEPGKALKSNVDFVKDYNLDNELEKAKAAAQLIRENYEDVLREVAINYPPKEFINHILWAVDPFYINVDREGDALNPADVENDDPIRFADCGPYCALTLADEGWLIPGKEENELQVRGRRYRFYSEKEMNIFKNNVDKYVALCNKKNLKLPGPRILMMGIKGSGLHTQMDLINKHYKISRVELARDMLEILKREKEKRKRDRELVRGFKPREYDEDGNPLPDPEIDDDPEDFDLKAHEIEVVRRIFQGLEELVINGNMFDVEEGAIATPLVELLSDAKRLPEVCVFLKCKESSVVERVFDEQSIVNRYNDIMRQREEEKAKKRAEKIEELIARKKEEEAEILEPTEEELADIENELDDGEAPVLKDMIEEERTKLVEVIETQLSKLEDYIQSFQDAGIPTIVIETDKDIQSVWTSLSYQLKPYLEKRELILVKHQIRELKDTYLPYYEKSYAYRRSKFHNGCLEKPWALPREKDFPLIYNSRIYYFRSDEERKAGLETIFKLVENQAAPRDAPLNMKIFITGPMKTGKSTMAKLLEEKLGLVRIKIKHLLNRAVEYPFWQAESQIEDILRTGNLPNNQEIVDLIYKRIQLLDCVTRGFILDGFPQNREQAYLLTERGIIPDLVINMHLSRTEIMDRCFKNQKMSHKFGYDMRILHKRLDVNERECAKTQMYYAENFNNVITLSPKISRSGLLNKTKAIVNDILEKKYNLSIALITGQPTNISGLPITPKELIANAGEYENFSPVALKTKGHFISSNIFSPYTYFYNRKIYYLSSKEEEIDFRKNPNGILKSGLSLELRSAPRRVDIQMTYEAYKQKAYQLKGYCPVSLSRGKLEKGLPDLVLYYQDKFWTFKSENELLEFAVNPRKFEQVSLPQKLPLREIEEKDKSRIREKAKNGEATAYLEHHLGNITMKVMAQLGK